jgi:hypothetical protein
MIRSFSAIPLSLLLVACPEPKEEGLQVPPLAMVAPTKSVSPTPADVTSNDLLPPPGTQNVPADVKQRAIGALSVKGNAIKKTILEYVKRNTASTGGLLTVTDGDKKTAQLRYVRTHDPVRHKPGKGFIAMVDFQDPDGDPAAFYNVAIWVQTVEQGYAVSSVVMQAYPEKRDGEWVRMELFTVNDAYATPLK